MNRFAYFILRLSLGVTFIWTGVLILQDPAGWGGLIQPWALGLIPVELETMMVGTAALDIVIGALLTLNILPWLAALVGALHLAAVMVTTGLASITITVRDIGLLGACAALAIQKWPVKLR